MSEAENYDELAERLTGEGSVEGRGKALYGEEAAAYGRQLIAAAVGLEDLPKEDLEKLFNNSEFIKWVCYPDSLNIPEEMLEMLELLSDQTPSTLLYGGGSSGKIIIPAKSLQDNSKENNQAIASSVLLCYF